MRNLALFFFIFVSSIASSNTITVREPNGTEHTTGLFVPPDYFSKAGHLSFSREVMEALPESYEVPYTSVKNQGQCGSCSFFAATAVYESLLLQKYGQTPNLSEQNLMDCSKYDNYKCSGSFSHFRYLTESGQAAEVDFPYQMRATKCDRNFKPAAEKPVKWGVIGKGARATVDEVRAALVEKGALWITVNASNWGSGQTMRCTAKGQTNHAVTLVGYRPDPSYPGKYLFKIKNSWGTSWGSAGYVESWLGCYNMGETVSYMELSK